MSKHKSGEASGDDAYYDELDANLPRSAGQCPQSPRCQEIGCYACGQLVNQGRQGGTTAGESRTVAGPVWGRKFWDAYIARMRQSIHSPKRPCLQPDQVERYIESIERHKEEQGDFQDVTLDEDE